MNWLMKVIIFATVIHGVHVLIDGLHYSHVWVPLGIVFFLATVGHFADQWILPRWGNGLSSVSGASFITATIWGAQFLFPGSDVRLSAALIVGIILGIVEYAMHRDILRYGM